MDVEEYFQIKIVDGETVFVCNICNKGLDNDQEITKHIKVNRESLKNDDIYDDTDLYKCFEEEGHRLSVKLDLVDLLEGGTVVLYQLTY